MILTQGSLNTSGTASRRILGFGQKIIDVQTHTEILPLNLGTAQLRTLPKSPEQIYFIALLPPADFQAEVTTIKEYFAVQYNSSHALKSPPHITLQAPFKWEEGRLPELAKVLAEFAAGYPPVPVILSGFGAFTPRVIYINPLKTPELMTVQADLTARLQSDLGIVDEKDRGRPFAPHMTVAFKDLSKSAFKAAWPEFKQRPLFFQFDATNLTLLVHSGGRWHVKSEFPFVPSP